MKNPTGQELINHINDKWINKTCPYCGGVDWTVSEKIFELREFNNGSLNIGGIVTPVIPVVCNKCGNTVLINMIITGLLKE